MDYKNLTHVAVHSNDRVMRTVCRINDEFRAKWKHWDSIRSIGGDALSRLPTSAKNLMLAEHEAFEMSKLLA